MSTPAHQRVTQAVRLPPDLQTHRKGIRMANCETTDKLIDLQNTLMKISDMVGWLCTSHRYVVNYKNNPEATARIQAQLDSVTEFINVIYICSILDEAGFNPSNKWISSNDRKEFKAWVHIRHTGAHAPGGRAKVYYKDFDSFMSSTQNSLSGLKKSCIWDATSIKLPYAMSYRFFQYIEYLIRSAIGYCANRKLPP